MNRHCHSALTLITLLVLASVVQAQEINMFNGRDLSGWKGLSSIWSVKNGAITGKLTSQNNPGANTFIVWQGGEVKDFDLTCKYKLTAENPEGMANSGVQFRAAYENESLFALRGYQAELDPGTHHPKIWPEQLSMNGCLSDDGHIGSGLLAPVGTTVIVHAGNRTKAIANYDVTGSLGTAQSAAASYRKADWNECRIVAVGTHLQVFINGIQTVDATDESHRYTAGLIGLQLHCYNKGLKTVQYKDLRLKILQSSPMVNSASSASLASIQTDSNQPRLDVLKDQAPNATEWALAPLEEALPPNIRQNLTYLREDLLDEYKQKPKASQDAYKLAHQLCTNLLTTLDERDQARVRAGLRSVQADAGIVRTNQALEARRNYLMSWPQYAREQAQRAELIRQGTAAAQVGKEMPKVEWSNRASALRKALDDLYAKFREELRQSAK